MEFKGNETSNLFGFVSTISFKQDKKGVLALAEKGHELIVAKDAIKDPYIFEFLELPKDKTLKERGLEKKLVDNLQIFLLELGKGFSFVARQFKITIDN